MRKSVDDELVFLTTVRTPGERRRAQLLIDSLRSFGGALNQCPIWVFEASSQKVPCGSLTGPGVQVLPLQVPDTVGDYLYAAKVAACARAEELAGREVLALVFLAPENLIVSPPLQFDLETQFDVAVRPVHIRNVGLLTTQPVDSFWRGVYDVVGVRDLQTTVESFVDGQHLRAYFNSAAFAADPSKGLFRRWLECFGALVCDQEYQSRACQDAHHRIFLHQAVLSALIATSTEPERVRILSPDYVYPYNLHESVPPARRARALNDLVCLYYEDRLLNPRSVEDIGIHEPLLTWLTSRADADPS